MYSMMVSQPRRSVMSVGSCFQSRWSRAHSRSTAWDAESRAFPASTSDLTQTMHICISVGVATFPDDGEAALEVVQKADQALFRAKLSGRNRSCVFDPEVDKPGSFHQAVDASAIIYGPADAQ